MEELYQNGESHWREAANCASTDPEIMFPEKGGSTKMAKKVCDMCDVTVDCLAYQLTLGKSEQIGYAGGASPKQRKAMLKAAVA